MMRIKCIIDADDFVYGGERGISYNSSQCYNPPLDFDSDRVPVSTTPVSTTPVSTTTVPTPISTTPTTSSLATSPIVSNTTSPISLVPSGMAGDGTGAGNSTENPQASNGGAKEFLLDKWKKLPDWKKGLIILAIAAGSYYGYKQLK